MFYIFTLSDFKQMYLCPCSLGPLSVTDLGCYVTVDSVDNLAVGRGFRFPFEYHTLQFEMN